MANTKSAKKAIRVSGRRNAINNRVRKSYRTVKKQITDNLAGGDIKAAKELVPAYQSEIDMAVKKGTLKKNTASRYKSRLVNQVKKAENK